jgi:hypothetical protein
MEVSGYLYVSAALPPETESFEHRTQSQSEPFGKQENLRALPGFEPHTVQPIA